MAQATTHAADLRLLERPRSETTTKELIVNRRQYLLATLSAVATVPAMRASAAAQFVATPSVTSLDERSLYATVQTLNWSDRCQQRR